MKINYIKGDATNPPSPGNKIITHVCNDIGGWGRGFVMALSARWKEPEMKYREWFASGENFELGEMQLVQVETDIWIANMIGQRDIRRDKYGNPPVRYDAIQKALAKVSDTASAINASVHMPRIGCGLAGGDWIIIEKIVEEELSAKGIVVTVYDF